MRISSILSCCRASTANLSITTRISSRSLIVKYEFPNYEQGNAEKLPPEPFVYRRVPDYQQEW